VNNAMALQGGGLNRVNGVAIWMKLEGECCVLEDCWCLITYKRYDWEEKTVGHDGWLKCTASSSFGTAEFPGFAAADQAGIAAAMPTCILQILGQFTCP
jgi:hypothetical protein